MFRSPREHDDPHLRLIRQLPCSIRGCRSSWIDAAHVRAGNLDIGKRHVGAAEKPSDSWTVPLCRVHHREQHSMGELEFWRSHGIDPFELALALSEAADVEEGQTILWLTQHPGYVERPGHIPW